MSGQSQDALASDKILARLMALHPKVIDLSLGRIEHLMAKLGHPERHLPPVIHVAGTNGKGSTCAFARAILEAAGLRVHAYSSPHLVRFHERIRLSGKLIDEDELSALLEECETANAGDPMTFFEITTAAAFLAFTRHKADAVILEVGLGGRLDATNLIDRPAVTVITPIDLDHQHYLGDTIAQIAAEKAGIMKRGVPCIVGPQSDEAMRVIEARAKALHVPLSNWGVEFKAHEEHRRMVYDDDDGLLDLPMPRLPGAHQIVNAATASLALLLRTQANKSGCSNPVRSSGFSTVGTNRISITRRAKSVPNRKLLPVAIQTVRIGSSPVVSDVPRTRSVQTVAVNAASSGAPPNVRSTLSNSTQGNASIAIAVMALRSSSSFEVNVFFGVGLPNAINDAASASSVFPDPRQVALIANSGTQPVTDGLPIVDNTIDNHADLSASF